MALDLSTIDQNVNNILAAPAAPPSGNGSDDELERLRKENAELKQRQLEADRHARIKSAVAASSVQDNGPTNGEMTVRRTRAIAEAGNVAKWYKYSVADRVNILTDGGYIPVTDKELSKYFGPKATTGETTRLKASDPRRFRSYRATAVELGWIG